MTPELPNKPSANAMSLCYPRIAWRWDTKENDFQYGSRPPSWISKFLIFLIWHLWTKVLSC